MAYKMKRGNSAVPFKELGSSPAKQGTENFNFTGDSKSTTPKYSTTKASGFGKGGKQPPKPPGLPKNFNKTGTSKAGKFAKVTKPKRGFKISKLPKKALLTTIGSFAAKRALGAADVFLGNESLGKGSTLTAEQRGAKPMPKPDFKGINKSLQKSMYKPLPK
tara:strand:+ start:46 stop:531 length:486 start_codon:yes stop_codon:yes gene_type:complete